MSAGDAYVKTADPGVVPATSLKVWQLIVLMSTPEEADTMRRPQTVGRSMGGVSIWRWGGGGRLGIWDVPTATGLERFISISMGWTEGYMGSRHAVVSRVTVAA
jgi:hypothetical protein